MINIFSDKSIYKKIFEFLKKAINKSKYIQKEYKSKYIQKFYFSFDFRYKKLIKFCWEIDIYFTYKLFVFGLKLRPIIEKKKNKNKNFKFNREYFKNTCIQLTIIKKQFEPIEFITTSLFMRYYISNIKNIKQTIRFPRYSMFKALEVVFEETADELKFILNTDFIQLSLSQNMALGRCWLTLRSSFDRILKFWKIYITSCYNLMTRCKKTFEINQYQKNHTKSNIYCLEKILDVEFFYLKKLNNIDFSLNSLLIAEKKKNFSYDYTSNKTLIQSEYDTIRWRNRYFKKLLILKKKGKKILKNKLKLLIC
nr:hypothetical protein Cry52Nrm1_p085 [Cryptomonas curvata]